MERSGQTQDILWKKNLLMNWMTPTFFLSKYAEVVSFVQMGKIWREYKEGSRETNNEKTLF